MFSRRSFVGLLTGLGASLAAFRVGATPVSGDPVPPPWDALRGEALASYEWRDPRAEALLYDHLRELAVRHPIVVPPANARAPTGEPFLTVATAWEYGVGRFVEPTRISTFDTLPDNEMDAVRMFRTSLDNCFSGIEGTLYVRRPVEVRWIDPDEDHDHARVMLTIRCMISPLPVRPDAYDEPIRPPRRIYRNDATKAHHEAELDRQYTDEVYRNVTIRRVHTPIVTGIDDHSAARSRLISSETVLLALLLGSM